jgi:hypothetical protein
VIARPLWNSCYLLARFSVYVSTLFGLKKTDNFSKFPQQIVHLFFHHFC